MSGTAITTTSLRKSYGTNEAVRGGDLEVRRGEVFGLSGPNGTGKTTVVEILDGSRQWSSGDVEVPPLLPLGAIAVTTTNIARRRCDAT